MLEIKRRPYSINWSGNPITYELYDAEAEANADITFEVRVLFGKYAQEFSELAIISLTPFNGTAKVDIAELLQSNLSYFVPNAGLAAAQVTDLQTGTFYIHYRSLSTANTDTPWITTEEENPLNVIKGGIHPYAWRNNNFFTTYYHIARPFLTWQMRGRLVSLNEPIYLLWLNKDYEGDNIAIQVKIDVTYDDTIIAMKVYPLPHPLKRYNVYYLPAGAAQMNLLQLQAGKNIWYWDVYLIDDNGTQLTEKFRMINDHRNDYNQRNLLYRNSLGGLDTLRVRGVIETTINLDGIDYEPAQPADWHFSEQPGRFEANTPHKEMPSYKGDIGHLEKEEQDRLRDVFINREVYLVSRQRLLPVKLLTKQFRLHDTTDKRFTLPIEWMAGDGGSYHYTPESVDLGIGEGNFVCSARLLISLGIPTGSGSDTQVNFVYKVIGGPVEKLQYKISGYIEEWKDLPYEETGVVSHTVQTGQSVTLTMRTVCFGNSPGQPASRTALASTDPPAAGNSIIKNNTGVVFNYVLLRSGVLLKTGTIEPGTYDTFHTLPAIVDFDIKITGVQPSAATLLAFGLPKNGTIVGQDIHFENIFIPPVRPGCTITIS